MRVALIGYGNVARAFARLLAAERKRFPFRIAGVHTLRHGTAYGDPLETQFGEPAAGVDAFLERTQPEVVVELTSLEPLTGEPALTHIRSAFQRGIHVVTANKGPIAHAYATLRAEAAAYQVEFRYESTVMDGSPVFNMVRSCLPGVRIHGITGALNSTTKVILGAIERGQTFEEGLAEARGLGITEADPAYDIDGWDSAVKAAALANVLMDADVTPATVRREGIRGLSETQIRDAARQGDVYVLLSRAIREPGGAVTMTVRPERLHRNDPLATARGTSNLVLFHTDLMGTIGTLSIDPGVPQTAYGVLSDLVDIARTI